MALRRMDRQGLEPCNADPVFFDLLLTRLHTIHAHRLCASEPALATLHLERNSLVSVFTVMECTIHRIPPDLVTILNSLPLVGLCIRRKTSWVTQRITQTGIVGFEPTNTGIKIPCLSPLGDIPLIVV